MKYIWPFVLCLILFSVAPSYGEDSLQIVVLDPGHGGYNVGIQVGQVKEKDLSLSLAREIKAIFLDIDVDVFLSRKIDHYESISERRSKVNDLSPDIFVSLHLAEGGHFTVYTAWYDKAYSDLSIKEFYAIESRQRKYIYESEHLAKAVTDTLRREMDSVKVYVRKMPLPLISSIGAPAIMIEVPSEGLDYSSDSGDLSRIASALVHGILRYYEQQ